MSADVLTSRPCLRNITNGHVSSHPVVAKKVTISPVVFTSQESTPRNTPTDTPREQRVYTREFLLKFKAMKSSFPPGESPSELIEIYNRECQARDQRAAALATPEKLWTPVSTAPNTPGVAEDINKVTTPMQVEGANIETTPVKAFKLRIPSTGEKLVNKPLFTTPQKVSRTPTTLKATPNQDKENPSKPSHQSIISFKKVKPLTQLSKPAPSLKDQVKPSTVTELTSFKPADRPMVESPIKFDINRAVPQVETATDDLVAKLTTILRETDPRRLEQRQKQIDYGKNTIGYQTYLVAVPKNKRRRENPKTPNKHQSCSKRSWDGQIRKWRRSLHTYDPAGTVLEDDIMMEDVVDEPPAKIDTN